MCVQNKGAVCQELCGNSTIEYIEYRRWRCLCDDNALLTVFSAANDNHSTHNCPSTYHYLDSENELKELDRVALR